ncbi:MAG TPA: ABC transporter ATP-binding protein [Candidatus Obscuribacterales bacterium]
MIELKDISRIYSTHSQPVAALTEVSLSIRDGEMVAIMGASGSGKSTLMNIIGLLDRPTGGQYILDGKRVDSLSEEELSEIRNRSIGFVFQQFNLLPRLNALDNVMLPLLYARESNGDKKRLRTRKELESLRQRKAEEVLTLMGLKDRMAHRPNQLSGGQQQRVSIARALVNDPSILLADEPTGALDSHTAQEIMTILKELNDRGMTVILVTHDAEVASWARRKVRLKDGKIVSDSMESGTQ